MAILKNGGFGGRIGRTYKESQPSWEVKKTPRENAPNIVFVVLDDVGFSDIGCYGSEIHTPAMDKLAEGGLRYNNFTVTAMCSPTRAALLTGRNAHAVGMGIISEWASGFPGYQGRISKSAATLAEILNTSGYNTMAVGKWHLTPNSEITAAGPVDEWPCGRGFERWYGFHGSLADQWHPDLYADNRNVEAPSHDGYHLSEDLGQQAIKFVSDQQGAAPHKPFFLYLAFGACHWPHHVPASMIQKYHGKYDQGWEAVRVARWKRQMELGIIPEGTTLSPSDPGVSAWDDLSPDMQKLCARQQEVYAAYMEHTDLQIGRLLDHLEAIGITQNTVIVLLSDNGASAEGGPFGALNLRKHLRYEPEQPEYTLANMDRLGSEEALNHYATGWAQVSNTPLKWYKKDTHGGGIRAPLILHWSEGIRTAGIRSQFHHVTDIVPTILEMTGIEAPDVHAGVSQLPLDGISMRYTFDSSDTQTRKISQHYELLGDRAIWLRGWKAVARHKKGEDFDTDRWELYQLDSDFSECNDLAATDPERLRGMIDLWWREADGNSMLPLDDREWERFVERKKLGVHLASRHVYFPMMDRLDRLSVPDTRGKSYTIRAWIDDADEQSDGALLALGSRFGGYVLHVSGGYLTHEYVYTESERYRVQASKKIPVGKSVLAYCFQATSTDSGYGTLLIDGNVVGVVDIPRMWPISGILGGLLCGRDAGSPVGSDYACPYTFTGKISRVELLLGDETPGEFAALDFAMQSADD